MCSAFWCCFNAKEEHTHCVHIIYVKFYTSHHAPIFTVYRLDTNYDDDVHCVLFAKISSTCTYMWNKNVSSGSNQIYIHAISCTQATTHMRYVTHMPLCGIAAQHVAFYYIACHVDSTLFLSILQLEKTNSLKSWKSIWNMMEFE